MQVGDIIRLVKDSRYIGVVVDEIASGPSYARERDFVYAWFPLEGESGMPYIYLPGRGSFYKDRYVEPAPDTNVVPLTVLVTVMRYQAEALQSLRSQVTDLEERLDRSDGIRV